MSLLDRSLRRLLVTNAIGITVCKSQKLQIISISLLAVWLQVSTSSCLSKFSGKAQYHIMTKKAKLLFGRKHCQFVRILLEPLQ